MWYIVKILNFEVLFGVVFVVFSVLRFIFMIVGGVVVDKFLKKNIMFYFNIIWVIFVVIIFIWFIVGDIMLYIFVLFVLFFGFVDVFFWLVDGFILLELVEKSWLI